MSSSAAARHDRTDKPTSKVLQESAKSTSARQSPPPFPRRSSSSSKAPQLDSPPKHKASSPITSASSEKEIKLPPVSEFKPRSRSTVSTPTTEQPPDPPAKAEGSVINMETFGQILEMDDDDDDREFSKSIVFNFFEQANSTLVDIDDAIETKDLPKISSLGHFLKGSSGALGVDQVQHSCEKMQHYGQLRDEEKGCDLKADVALGMIVELHKELKVEYAEAEKWLKNYFGQDP